MTLLARTAVTGFLLVTLQAHGQSSAETSPIPAKRWILSYNPLGTLEPAMAIGVGIGYRFNRTTELWTETSVLKSVFTPAVQFNGVRQILQLKKFLYDDEPLFLAIETRFKYFTMTSTDNFYNPSNHEMLTDRLNTSSHYVWGAGLQIGYRRSLTHNGKFQLELTAGLGVKNKTIHWNGIPPGYFYRNVQIDVNIKDLLQTAGTQPYLPGSIRLIYTFGKSLPK